jgi:hypothetical protein
VTDRIVELSLHESTLQLIVTLLRALEDLVEPGHECLPPDVRTCLAQALDTAADLDLLFGELADSLGRVNRRNATGEHPD